MKIKEKELIALVTLILLLISDLFVFGSQIAIAASETNKLLEKETNNPNVEFWAEIKNEKKTGTELECNISEKNAIVLSINPGNKGILTNSSIKVEKQNFEIEKNEIENKYIKKIDDNGIIYLNTITYGNTVKIEIPVKFVKKDIIEKDYFMKEAKINFEADYQEKEDKIEKINSSKLIKINWTDKDDINLIQSTGRYINLGTNETILEHKIETKVINNKLPIETENLIIETPKIDNKTPEKIYVVKNGTKLKETEIEYQKEKGILKINPEEKQNLEWTTGNNNYEIIYNYTNVKTEEKNIINLKVISLTKLYNEKEIKKENFISNYEIKKNGNLIEITQSSTANAYKGYLYANSEEETIFEEENKIKILEYPYIENIEINNIENKFSIISGEKYEASKNIEYKETIINKENIKETLGETGYIEILDKNNKVIETVTTQEKEDENGNIKVKYPEKTERIILRTSKPLNGGEINYKNIKTIRNKGIYTKEQLKKFTNLDSKTIVTTNLNESISETEIELKDTTLETKIEIDQPTLTTLKVNNKEIKIKLMTNNPQYELFENPKFKIELPKDVEKINLKNINMIYEDELKIKKTYVEGRTIIIETEGKQTKYKEGTIEGTNIILNAEIKLNKKATNKNTNIKLNYSINGKEIIQRNYEAQNAKVEIIGAKEVILSNNIKELGIETLGDQEEIKVDIAKGKEEKTVEGQIEIINNREEKIEKATIIGEFPSNSIKNNMGIEIIEPIKLITNKEYEIYYTNNEKATEEIEKITNTWTKNFNEVPGVKKYLIIVKDFCKDEIITGTYKMKIPSNLEYNQSAKIEYEIIYENKEKSGNKKIKSTPVKLDTGVGPQVEVELKAKRGKESVKDIVKVGEIINYNIIIKNTGNVEAKNIKYKGLVPEGTKKLTKNNECEAAQYEYYITTEERTVEGIIEKLKPGESVEKEYLVRVTEKDKKISNEVTINYNEINKVSNKIDVNSKEGKIKLTAIINGSEEFPTYSGNDNAIEIIIENISNEKIKNIELDIELPKEYGIIDIFAQEKINGKLENSTIEKNNENIIKLGDLEKGSNKRIYIRTLLHDLDNKEKIIETYGSVNINTNDKYYLNTVKEKIEQVKFETSMTCSNNKNYIKKGEKFNYNIKIKNTGKLKIVDYYINDNIPKELEILKATENGKEFAFEDNKVRERLNIDLNTESNINIEVKVRENLQNKKIINITNYATIEDYLNNNKEIGRTNNINHTIESEYQDENNNIDDGENNQNNNENENKPDENGIIRNIISGIAWKDENRNGKRENNEELLSDINVKIINIKTNKYLTDEKGNEVNTKTNEYGVYSLENIPNGKYIITFNYNEEKYQLTTYKQNGVSENENSKANKNTITVNGKSEELNTTDIIEINSKNISNIDIGLVEKVKFDLKLDKYISKATIINKKGTTIKGYNNVNLAKIEIDAKDLKDTKLIIEYTIKVSNIGELAGYVKNIVDYLPKDLNFNSNINKDWYLKNNNLYNNSLENIKIKPGESKEVKLVLTKKMNENNTGIIFNMAEIEESINDYGQEDINSKAGNRKEGENDISVAKYIVAIRTGKIKISIILLIILTMILIFLSTLILVKKIKTKK